MLHLLRRRVIERVFEEEIKITAFLRVCSQKAQSDYVADEVFRKTIVMTTNEDNYGI